MYTERHLHLSRQQFDISGQAQRVAAQRAAMHRRRQSLADDNDPDAPWQTGMQRLPYCDKIRPTSNYAWDACHAPLREYSERFFQPTNLVCKSVKYYNFGRMLCSDNELQR